MLIIFIEIYYLTVYCKTNIFKS